MGRGGRFYRVLPDEYEGFKEFYPDYNVTRIDTFLPIDSPEKESMVAMIFPLLNVQELVVSEKEWLNMPDILPDDYYVWDGSVKRWK